MTVNNNARTIKGKYAGTCPDCNIMRGTWENKGTICGRCGHVYTTIAKERTLDGDVKPKKKSD